VTRALLGVLALALAATASAQNAKAPGTKTPATKTADSTKTATKSAAPQKSAAAQTKSVPQTKAGAPQSNAAAPGTGRPGLAVTPEQAARPRAPVIMREVFDYDAEGRRDPFFPLLSTAELRPTVADLKLIGILYDPSGRRSVVTLRDMSTNTRYQVTTGTILGRMKVVLIKPKAIFFAIEEFGLNRQDSLVLGDTTKARAR
jgi:hypothetical protein